MSHHHMVVEVKSNKGKEVTAYIDSIDHPDRW
jgi:hypothetical protein